MCGGTASLKFRQFKSAVCDAFGVFSLGVKLCRGVAYLGTVECWGIWGVVFGGLNLSFVACFWFETGLLAVKLIFMYCILVPDTCTTMPTGHPTLCIGF